MNCVKCDIECEKKLCKACFYIVVNKKKVAALQSCLL